MTTPTSPHAFNNFQGWDNNSANEANAQMKEWAGAAAIVAHFLPGTAHYYGGNKWGHDMEVDGVGKIEIKSAWTSTNYPGFLCHSPLTMMQKAMSKYCALVTADDTTMDDQTYDADGTMKVELSIRLQSIHVVPVSLLAKVSTRKGNGISVTPMADVEPQTLEAFIKRLPRDLTRLGDSTS